MNLSNSAGFITRLVKSSQRFRGILQWSLTTCRWVQVCGATFGERICSQPQWSCHALPFSSTCSASTGHYVGSVHFCEDGHFWVLCHMTICCLFEDYMFKSSFEHVIVRNSQRKFVTRFVLWFWESTDLFDSMVQVQNTFVEISEVDSLYRFNNFWHEDLRHESQVFLQRSRIWPWPEV